MKNKSSIFDEEMKSVDYAKLVSSLSEPTIADHLDFSLLTRNSSIQIYNHINEEGVSTLVFTKDNGTVKYKIGSFSEKAVKITKSKLQEIISKS